MFTFERALQILNKLPISLGNYLSRGGYYGYYLEQPNITVLKENNNFGFKMFLFDQQNYASLRQSFFEFEGDSLLSGQHGQNARGFEKYRIKLVEEIHLEEDQRFHCKNYNSPGEYGICLEDVSIQETKVRLRMDQSYKMRYIIYCHFGFLIPPSV